MTQEHPYRNLPDYTRWSRSIAGLSPENVDPVVNFPFRIGPSDKLATAGSCFAQHIARHLQKEGFNYFVVEDGHPMAPQELRSKYNYGTFSARYGNIYTVRQLRQLIERAFDGLTPTDDYWRSACGFIDPLRPNIQPRPFATIEELYADRAQHLSAVRRMFEELDYFVFTLGLTEAWISAADGVVYPTCPGVAGGIFDDTKHVFKNFNIDEVREDLDQALARIRAINSKARVILTVSPVPLVATADQQHVLVSTTYSKSILRVACTDIVQRYPTFVSYFPSYEIIVGNYNRGHYFETDLRTVTGEGVAHVMKLFMKHASIGGDKVKKESSGADCFVEQMLSGAKIVCEEELIELSNSDQPKSS